MSNAVSNADFDDFKSSIPLFDSYIRHSRLRYLQYLSLPPMGFRMTTEVILEWVLPVG